MAEGETRKVKHAQFKYYIPTKSVDMSTGKERDRLSPRIARRGEWVTIPRSEDVELGEKVGAFYTEEELNPPQEENGDDDIAEEDDDEDEQPSHDELVAWIRSERPTASAVVARAGDDPEMARALIEAENEASGGDPRVTVIRELEKIAG